MTTWTNTSIDTGRRIDRAALRHAGVLRGWLARSWQRLASAIAVMRAEAELHAMSPRELHDLGLDRGGIAHAARKGRERE